MKRILVITNNLQQASFRVRVEALIEPMRQRGFDWQVQVRPRGLLARRTLLQSAREYDGVILQRKLLDPADASLLRRHAKTLYFDVDDAVMYHARPVGLISSWRTHRRFRATARAVDVVVAGNAHLAERFAAEAARTFVIPTVVEPSRYSLKQHAPTDRVRLIWIGSSSTLPYLQSLLPTLRETARRITGLTLTTIADATVGSAPELPVEHIAWSAETEAASLLAGDIGIAPTPRDRWTLGKCGFKIIQCMAAGLPVIASPVGANAEIVLDGETGFHAETSSQWITAIERLSQSVDLRATLGAAARKRVESDYSVRRAADSWASVLSR